MKFRVKQLAFFVAACTTAQLACQKELSCEDCKSKEPPIANAGLNQGIILPKDSVLLDASSSSDPDGTIIGFHWSKISGPVTGIVQFPDSAQALLTGLGTGVYQIELTVKDNDGLSSKDTVQVTVSGASNNPPQACAGQDQEITLPTNSATLEGGCPWDYNIMAWVWTKIAGPSSFNITNANQARAVVSGLVQGTYLFELKVTDFAGLSGTDTIQVTVYPATTTICSNFNRPQTAARLIPIGTLSQKRFGMAIAFAGNKLVFAGGYSSENPSVFTQSSRVDIYDIVTQTWSTAELSVARSLIATVAVGNKIFFGGGERADGTWPTDVVDIYDVATNSWSVTHLSIAGHSIAAATLGNKIVFAGGDGGFTGIGRSRKVDIYDLSSNSWSSASLSEEKIFHSALVANNTIYFAGGEVQVMGQNGNFSWYNSRHIDMYHASGAWSTSTLDEGKTFAGAIAVNDIIYWAGGLTGTYPNIVETCSVEIRNTRTGSTSHASLFKPGSWSSDGFHHPILKDNKILFLRSPHRFPVTNNDDDNKFDIYDPAAGSWSIGTLPANLDRMSVLSVNNTAYIGGGAVNGVFSNQVWRLEF